MTDRSAEDAMRKLLTCFVEDPPNTDFQRGYLSGLVEFASAGLDFPDDDKLLVTCEEMTRVKVTNGETNV